MSGKARWEDLAPRVVSAAILIALCALEVWLGGIWFQLLIGAVCGIGTWELARMAERGKGVMPSLIPVSILAGFCVVAAGYLPKLMSVPVLVLPAVIGVFFIKRDRRVFGVGTLAVMLAGGGMVHLRDQLGLEFALWIICLVVVTDVAGYFGGKTIGGPKFWPKFSPKKTWAGIVSGWIGAAGVGWLFTPIAALDGKFIVYSVVVSFASQLGDIAESAVKRRVGVKDSSSLIPGHGGVLDRFDGLIGAALFVMLSMLLTKYPAVF
ncbi:phosphatidate cytidylyltransferase [Pseudaestuariivita sp.]|uniref:phosphatidate cytidylyltransferase n=1 Tax=Pseudaestuariivita sp. TaxID=2211669 RepID=UPI004058ABC6